MEAKRLSNIDGLRAIAALSVFFQHWFGDMLRHSDSAKPLYQPVLAIVENIDLGRFGVVLFFFISGFVVPFSIKGETPLVRFAVSRFFRLYPAMWMAIAALVILFWSQGNPAELSSVLANLTMVPVVFGKQWLSNIYWTLFVELLFYFLIAMLFWMRLVFNFRTIFFFSLFLVFSTVVPVLLRTHFGINVPVQYLGMHLSFLFCGLLVRLAVTEKIKNAFWAIAFLFCLQMVAIAAVADFSLSRGDGFVGLSVMPVLVAYLLAAAVFVLSVASRRPQSPTLSFVGQISYSIYLFHWIAAQIVYLVFPPTGNWLDFLSITISLAATIVVSWAVYTVVEKPMIDFAKYIMDRGFRLIRQRAP
ncbi:acyltransferase family protein [Phyllobacterium myrsinacearum]|uniref:Peptidoglycan/LPS O-acetylase OafA/YrhL n=1 Tax=Phyllobacterium myrsinacearum TaxID=28101 RepID=A0A839ERM1_9HYPH|nr:acyltransferase [Phyllobacterium myrsinacearum]MBA8881462.1 peptidoglycan/LPS O-acetylase OafA/YrhL [Phyllobacterium myrsinacearum]